MIGCGEVFYVKIYNTTNHFLWNKCLDVRDSGPCSIGSIFCFLGPKAIAKLYCNNIMLLTPSSGAILMNEPISRSILDYFGNVTNANKTISFQMTSTIKLQNYYIYN